MRLAEERDEKRIQVVAIKEAAEDAGEDRRLNRVKASPEDVRARPAPIVFRYRTGASAKC